MKSTRIAGLLVGLFCLIGIVMAYQMGQREIDPSAEETLAMIIDNGGPRRVLGVTTSEEYEEQMLQLVEAGLSTESVGQVYSMIAHHYIGRVIQMAVDRKSGLADVHSEPIQKAEHFVALAMQQPLPMKESLHLVGRLASAKQALSDRKSAAWPLERKRIVAQLWQGLKTAKEANLPEQAPEELSMPSRLNYFDSRVGDRDAFSEETKQGIEQDNRERRQWAKEIDERDDLIQAVRVRDALENQLRDLYAINPVNLDELAELGNAIVGDAAYVERIVQKAADEYDRRYQEHLELNKHVFEKK